MYTGMATPLPYAIISLAILTSVVALGSSSSAGPSARSKSPSPTPSSLVHMEFIYQCLASNRGIYAARKCPAESRYSCAKVVRSHAAGVSVDKASRCITLQQHDTTVNNDDQPCFAETWISKLRLLSLMPDSGLDRSSVQLSISVSETERIGHATLNLSSKATRQHPWISLDLLEPRGVQLWRQPILRLCIVDSSSDDVSDDVILTAVESRLGGRKRPAKNKTVTDDPFVVSGFRETSVLRLDQFLQGMRPKMMEGSRRRKRSPDDLMRILPEEHLSLPTPQHVSTPTAVQQAPTNQPSDTTLQACNRTALYISFSELQPRDNVVRFPQGLNIFDCVGQCDDAVGLAASAHAFIMHQVRREASSSSPERRQAVREVSGGCCVPTEFEQEPINLLVDDGGFQTIFPITNPTVKRCGCT